MVIGTVLCMWCPKVECQVTFIYLLTHRNTFELFVMFFCFCCSVNLTLLYIRLLFRVANYHLNTSFKSVSCMLNDVLCVYISCRLYTLLLNVLLVNWYCFSFVPFVFTVTYQLTCNGKQFHMCWYYDVLHGSPPWFIRRDTTPTNYQLRYKHGYLNVI